MVGIDRLRRRWAGLLAGLRALFVGPPPEDPWFGLLPPLTQPTFPRWQGVSAMGALVVTAGVLLWPLPVQVQDHVLGVPGNPDIPGALTVWMAVGLHGGALSDLVLVSDSNFPVGADLIARQAWPIDAVLALPLHALFGWPDWFNLGAWMWLAAMGIGAAWLGNRWWNDPWAGFVCGVGYQACNLAAMALGGRLVLIAAFSFLPLVVGLWIRALDRGTWRAAGLCGVAMSGLLLSYWFGALWVLLAALPPLLLTLAARRWEAAWVACTGTLIVTIACTMLPLAWMVGNLSLLPGADGGAGALYLVFDQWMSAYELTSTRGLLYGGDTQWLEQVTSPVAAVLAALGAAVWLRAGRRVAYPLALVLVGALFALGPYVAVGGGTNVFLPYAGILPLPGLGRMWWPMRFLAVTEVGLALLAGGLVVWLRARPGVLRGLGSGLVPVLLLVAAWQNSARPFGMTPWPLDVAAFADGEPGTPVLALPYPCAPTGMTNLVTFDQVGHQRPLVNGRVAPGFQAYTDPATAALHARFPALDRLVRLGLDGALSLDADDLASLRGLGIDRFYVDLEAFGPYADRAREQLLELEGITGPHGVEGRFWVVGLP